MRRKQPQIIERKNVTINLFFKKKFGFFGGIFVIGRVSGNKQLFMVGLRGWECSKLYQTLFKGTSQHPYVTRIPILDLAFWISFSLLHPSIFDH